MPQITAITLQKNKKIANLFIDGKFVTGLDLSIVVKQKLKEGTEISSNQLQKLLNTSIEEKLTSQTLNYLSYRPRSQKEIQTYLHRKLYKQAKIKNKQKLIDKVVNKLKQKNIINDEEFSQWWIEQRTKHRPKGNFAITQELRMKGIDNHIISNALKGRDEIESARESALKKQKTFKKF